MEKTIISESGHSIFYKSIGKGYPVILVHGFGEDGRIWDTLIPYLDTSYQYIIPDLPGSGKSELKAGTTSIEALAEDIKTIVIEEGIQKCYLIGHSMGGYITLAYAEKHPLDLKGFGLFHSTAFADDEEKIKTRKKGIEFLQKHGSAEFLKQAIPNLFSKKSRETLIREVENQIKQYAYMETNSLVEYYQAMIDRKEKTYVLANSNVPVLYIIGEKDSTTPMKDNLKQVHQPKVSYIDILEDTGHLGMIENTLRCANFLNKYLRETLKM